MKSTERKHDAIVIQSETVKYAELLAQETTSMLKTWPSL